MPTPLRQDVLKLGSEMLQFSSSVEKLDTPDAVLDGLHKATFPVTHVSVLGAVLFPVRWGDWGSLEKGKTVFLHKSAPDGWWDEQVELNRKHPGPGFMLALMAIAPFTMSEVMRMLEPLGVERASFDLAHKYGMRDRLNCPVGGRWVVSFWSPKVLSPQLLSEEARAILFMGATFAAIRLSKLARPQTGRIGRGVALTARELAVLRLLSFGHPIREAADLLKLGEETVRSHLKKAQTKLDVHDRSQAVAQAIRRHLIP